MKNVLRAFSAVMMVFVLSAPLSGAEAPPQTASYRQTVETKGMRGIVTDVWLKDGRMRMESEIGLNKMITFVRPDGIYAYDQARNMLTKMPKQEQDASRIENPVEYIEYLRSIGAERTGSEMIKGYDCDIYTYRDESLDSDITVWVWKKYDFPVKMVVDNPVAATTAVFSNIKINEPIPDSMFDLPQNAQVIDISKGMGGFLKAFQQNR